MKRMALALLAIGLVVAVAPSYSQVLSIIEPDDGDMVPNDKFMVVAKARYFQTNANLMIAVHVEDSTTGQWWSRTTQVTTGTGGGNEGTATSCPDVGICIIHPNMFAVVNPHNFNTVAKFNGVENHQTQYELIVVIEDMNTGATLQKAATVISY